MPVEINQLSPAELAAAKPQILRIYAAAFGPPPYNRPADEAARFGESLSLHTRRRDFRFLVAADAATGAIEGFAYGHTGSQGQWWHDVVSSTMTRDVVARWLEDSFEVVEVAVDPPAQGRGTGVRLHDALLDGISNRTAVLSTIGAETVALGMYLRRGWQVLVPSMLFPYTPEPFQILGLDLTARRQTPR